MAKDRDGKRRADLMTPIFAPSLILHDAGGLPCGLAILRAAGPRRPAEGSGRDPQGATPHPGIGSRAAAVFSAPATKGGGP